MFQRISGHNVTRAIINIKRFPLCWVVQRRLFGTDNLLQSGGIECIESASAVSSVGGHHDPGAAPNTPPSHLPAPEKRIWEARHKVPRADPAALSSLVDVTLAMADVMTDYDHRSSPSTGRGVKRRNEHHGVAIDSSQQKSGEDTPAGRLLLRRADERHVVALLERFDELCSLPNDDVASEMKKFDTFLAVLPTVSAAIHFSRIPGHFPSSAQSLTQTPKKNKTAAVKKTLANPYFSQSCTDFVNAWSARVLEISAVTMRKAPEKIAALEAILSLHCGDILVVRHLIADLSSRRVACALTASEAIKVISLASLALKRRDLPAPDLMHLYGVIEHSDKAASAYSTKDGLLLLSSIVTLRDVRPLAVVPLVANRLAAGPARAFSPQDCLFAIKACAILTGVPSSFTAEVLRRVESVTPQLSPRQLAAICHSVVMMRQSRRNAHVIRNACAPEVRRLVPAVLRRTDTLKGQFSLQDARYTLDFLQSLDARHSLIFSQLTKQASD